jgi:hypothetical protein
MHNPKTHDSLFKWLIASFTEDFFEHYFPDINVKKPITANDGWILPTI